MSIIKVNTGLSWIGSDGYFTAGEAGKEYNIQLSRKGCILYS